MNNVSRLFRHDLRQATRSTIALVVLFGVVVIPSFFAWFNVLASWDPFGNTKDLKVAVANADEGYEGGLLPVRINIGDQVLSALRANADLDWVFTSPEQAVRGTESEEYYAALVLPPDFSRQMMTFLVPGATSARIDYYTNEKTNALSPKITGEAATDVSVQINETFTKTLNEVGLGVVASLADNLEDPETRAAIARLEANAAALASQLRAGADSAQALGLLVSASKPLVTGATSLATSSDSALRETAGAIGDGSTAARRLGTTLETATGSLAAAFSTSADSYRALGTQVDQLFTSLGSQSQATVATLNTLAGQVDAQIAAYQGLRDELQAQADTATDPALRDALELVVSRIDGALARQELLRDRIQEAATRLTQGEVDSQATRDEVIAVVDEARSAVEGVESSYSQSLRPQLEQLAGTLASVNGGFVAIGDDLSGAVAALSEGSGSLTGVLTAAEGTLSTISEDLEAAAARFDGVASALRDASESGDLSALTTIIGPDAQTFAGELTTPVALRTIPVFEVATFGAQMAPFYSVLGLWVGALLLSVLIRVDVVRDRLPFGAGLTLPQEYFGRYGIFAVLALLQSSLLYVGLIGFVGVRPVYPALLILAGWVMSLVFSLITYTLVLSFGEAGKALAVFLLVVQISAGGGAYPLSVLPQWFQNISPFLPVTHATSAVRAAIAGIYEGDFWISLGCLVLFVVPALLLGLVLRVPLIGFNDDLAKALESTRLM